MGSTNRTERPPPDEPAIVADSPGGRSAARPASAATTTHFGTVGLFEERGLVTQLRAVEDGSGTVCHYRRASGAEIALHLPAPHVARLDDLLLVRSLTMPDGRVIPVEARLPSEGRWVRLCDLDGLLDHYGATSRTVVRWSAGIGSLMGAAALTGLAAPLAGTAAVAALLLSAGFHRRDRKDRARVAKLVD